MFDGHSHHDILGMEELTDVPAVSGPSISSASVHVQCTHFTYTLRDAVADAAWVWHDANVVVFIPPLTAYTSIRSASQL